MSVFSRVRSFFSRHKYKFIVGGVIITGSVFLSKYFKQRLRDWQEKETLEFLDRNRKQSHFESVNRTSTQAIMNLSAALLDQVNILEVNQSTSTTDIIQKLSKNPENKIELWNRLKVLVFTKAAVLIYATVMLVVTLKVQFSIIGGYLCKDPNSVSTEKQEKYLSLCQNFLNNGIANLQKTVEEEVSKILSSVDLKKQLKLSDIEAIFWTIQTSLATCKNNPIENIKSYILPEDIPNTDDTYQSILRDTADLLESEELKSLATHCVNRGFFILSDRISEFYSENGKSLDIPTTSNPEFRSPFESKKPMAKLIPIVNGLLNKQSLPQTLVQFLTTNEKVLCFSANVYESLL